MKQIYILLFFIFLIIIVSSLYLKIKNTQFKKQIDCQLSDWSEWSECDRKIGIRTRTRSTTQPEVNNGTCPNLIEQQE